jgi:hypothetical protein
MPTQSLGVIVFTFMKFAFGIGIHFKLSTAYKDNFRVLAAHTTPNPAPTMATHGGAARRPLYRDHLGDFQLNSFTG